jgi:DnaK suppressor protein
LDACVHSQPLQPETQWSKRNIQLGTVNVRSAQSGGDMTEQIADLKAVLRNKRAELVESIRAQSSQLRVGDGKGDLIDQMQGMSRREEAVTFLDALNRALAAVNAVLLAMEGGSYGNCAQCGEPIASKRLAAIPWASNCIRCQEDLDCSTQRSAASRYWGEAA